MKRRIRWLAAAAAGGLVLGVAADGLANGRDRLDREADATAAGRGPVAIQDAAPAETDADDQAPASPMARPVQLRGSAHASVVALAASNTFEATVGSSRAVEYGVGGAVLLPRGFFVAVDFSRFENDGERVFVHDDEVFGLDIPLTVTMSPLELTAGYRIRADSVRRPATAGAPRGIGGLPLVPYVGGGIGWLSYRETSTFAEPRDNVDERFTSYHVLGGVEVPLWRMLGTAAELGYRWVPDAIGDTDGSAANLFNETDLGGLRFRVLVTATF